MTSISILTAKTIIGMIKVVKNAFSRGKLALNFRLNLRDIDK